VIGGTAALVQAVVASSGIREWVESLSISAIAVVSLTALAYREVKLSKAARLAHALPHLEEASDKLRDLTNFLKTNVARNRTGQDVQETALRDARNVIEDVLTIYVNMYSVLTSSRCRMCLKLVEFTTNHVTPDGISVFALARDKLSATENREHDKKRKARRIDTINDNSDFLSLWEKGNRYFFCNDLRELQDYETTSVNYWRNVEGNPNRNLIDKSWVLPYFSTIVWPIKQEVNEQFGIETPKVLGFVCVDSRVPSAFEEQLDAPLGNLLASTLYPILDLYKDLSSAISQRRGQGADNA
jgi:hypothetical protein